MSNDISLIPLLLLLLVMVASFLLRLSSEE